MNKKLLALAIGAVVAMPVSAVAAPTLYGKINLSLESQEDDTGNPLTSTDQWVLQNNASRIGVKGDAETGVEGVKGLYKAEFGVDADDGASPFTDRDIYVGLTGGFGTVLAGNMDTPTRTSQGKVDQFNDSSADISNYVGGELRAPNVVAYASPKIADAVTVTVALWQGEGEAGPDGSALEGIADAISASIVYQQDSLYLALGLDSEVRATGDGVDLDGTTDVYNDIVRLTAGYTTDSIELGLLYQTAEGVDTPATGTEDTSLVVSGAYKTGDWKFKAQYGQTEGDVAANTYSEIAVGADYMIGKSTTLNALFLTGEDDGTYERTVFGVGLEQKF